MLVYEGCHGVVYGAHHLWGHLDDGDFRACVSEVFGHLKTDEASTHDDCAAYFVATQV